jgi:thymidylate kinase
MPSQFLESFYRPEAGGFSVALYDPEEVAVSQPERCLKLTSPVPEMHARGLAIVHDLFRRFHEAGIAYCHWKSNEHLGAAVEGLTDLDILVESSRLADLQGILAKTGFKRFAAPPLRAYPGIEDYLAFDEGSGRLVHLHLHYQLTIGQSHLKGYRLPWEHRVLATRRRDHEYDIDCSEPAMELVLLLVRAALKFRLRDRLRATVGGHDFLRELAWLQERTQEAEVLQLVEELVGPAAVAPTREMLADPASTSKLAALAACVRHDLRRYRSFGVVGGPARAWVREAQWIVDAVNRRYLHHPIPLRRTSPRGGVVVVLVGADGSGKSSLARILVEWLGVKLDVMPLYFGSGDGPSAWYRHPMSWAHGLIRAPSAPREATASPAGTIIAHEARPISFRDQARVPWALALSSEKRGKIRRMVRAQNRGMIVVCDRFPQSHTAGFGDGPLLAHWRHHPSTWLRKLSVWEAAPYVEAAAYRPDLVLKIVVPPEVALARRPEMNLDQTLQRQELVEALPFSCPTRVHRIDGSAPLEHVAALVKKLVWDAL